MTQEGLKIMFENIEDDYAQLTKPENIEFLENYDIDQNPHYLQTEPLPSDSKNTEAERLQEEARRREARRRRPIHKIY